MRRKNIVILGSTGSIGGSALDVVRHWSDSFRVVGLSAHRNMEKLHRQVEAFSPRAVAVDDRRSAEQFKALLSKKGLKTTVFNHSGGMSRLATMKGVDLVLCGVVGARGLLPLVAALKAGKTVGLANKEALIVAGDLIMRLSRAYRAPMIPVDSEHSAIFQCLQGHNHRDVRRLILTASGGPFYRTKKNLNKISVQEALNHPTWKMGNKITVDSATLMNKGLEAIEAHFLFNVPMEKISIVIHPQSIVHSMVEFEDGATLAQLSHPDMRLPIQYALTYPDRMKTTVRRLDLEDVKRLEFDRPDFSRFPCLKLALAAGRKGGTATTALSSANEEAVRSFLAEEISFMEIAEVVGAVVKRHHYRRNPSLQKILKTDAWARREANDIINSKRVRNKK